MSAHKIEEASKQDKELKNVRERIKKGDFSNCSLPFKAIKEQLTTVGNIVL